MRLDAIMPIDFIPVREVALPLAVTKASTVRYEERLRALLEAECVHEMLTEATYKMERDVPAEMLALADRLWFGEQRPFSTARQAWTRLEDELEQWQTQLESERAALAKQILGIEIGDTVTAVQAGTLLRLSVTHITLYGSDDDVTFAVGGNRFRKDGTLGKVYDSYSLHFEEEDRKAASTAANNLPEAPQTHQSRWPRKWYGPR